jgi:uncharacterized membrane protein YheB (UPF0754 family)
MVDPVTTLTAGAITTLAFQKFVEAGSGELAKKFTESLVLKLETLRKKILEKLSGKSERVDEAIERVGQGDLPALDLVSKYLDVAMEDDPYFATEIQTIAHNITLELDQNQDNSNLTQTNYGGTNYQTKTGKDNTNFIGGTHQHGSR